VDLDRSGTKRNELRELNANGIWRDIKYLSNVFVVLKGKFLRENGLACEIAADKNHSKKLTNRGL
jgi:hypothetical protein